MFSSAQLHSQAGNLAVALEYARGGLCIFPCDWRPKSPTNDSPRKSPLVGESWPTIATVDQATIRDWWTSWPGALVGLPAGANDLLVIDCDRHGGPDGVAAFRKLVDERGELPRGRLTVQTQSGSFHIVFRQPATRLGNRRGTLPAGIDIRGDGGYIIAPGSALADGRVWRYVDGSPTLLDARIRGLPEPPEWLVAILAAGRKPAEVSAGGARLPEDVTPSEIAKLIAGAEAQRSEIAKMAPGTRRGTACNALGRSYAPLFCEGHLDEKAWSARLLEETGDDNAAGHSFSNGISQGDGSFVANRIAEMRQPTALIAEAEARGVKVSGYSGPSDEQGDGETTSTDLMAPRERGRAATMLGQVHEAKRDTRHVASVVAEAPLATEIARQFSIANRDFVFRIQGAGTVTTLRPDNDGSIREAELSDDDFAARLFESVRVYDRFELPAPAKEAGAVSADGLSVKVTIDEKTGATAELKTAKWARANFANLACVNESDLRDSVAWRTAKISARTLNLARADVRNGFCGAPLRPLRSVVNSPTLAATGEILARDGYHASARTFVALGDLHGRLDVPSDEALTGEGSIVTKAREVVSKFLDCFPYVDDLAKSVLASWLFSNVALPAFPLAPVHIFDAPTFGSGKSFAAKTIARIGAGVEPQTVLCASSRGVAEQDEEASKRIDAVILGARGGAVLLDDVAGGRLPNSSNFRTITSVAEAVSIRPLGKTELAKADPTRFLWAATANNIAVEGDMVRRCVVARLDRYEAEKRCWRQEAAAAHVGRVLASPEARGELVSAVLTVLRMNFLHRPARHAPIENFESWSAAIREAAVFVTGADPAATTELLRKDDPSAEEHAKVITALLTLTDGRDFKAADVVNRARALAASQAATPVEMAAGSLVGAFGGQRAEPSEAARRLGYFLRKWHDRWTEARGEQARARRMGTDSSKIVIWRIDRASGDGPVMAGDGDFHHRGISISVVRHLTKASGDTGDESDSGPRTAAGRATKT